MGKYEPLADRLRQEGDESWIVTFAEVERVLGFQLPASARKYREWWANQKDGRHSQARGWQDAGWQVWRVDLDNERVEFRRTSPSRSRRSEGEIETDAALFARASAYLGISDRNMIIREAMKALCEREASRRLARLGGTMPDLQVPPRRRITW